MTYQGKYFDGKSSAGYPASVKLNSFSIDIVYTAAGSQVSLEWQPDKVHPNDLMDEKVILRYGDFPFQYIEVNQANFGQELRAAYPQAKFHRSTYNFIFSTGFMGLLILALLALGFLVVSYFLILPAAAERIAVNVPVSWEKKLGDAAYEKMISPESVDTENSERVTAFFNQLNYKSAYRVELVVVKDKIVNAYALPGGKIVVYEGILRSMETSDELAALLSHEFSHVELKHSTKNIFRSLSSYMLISVLFGDASGVTAIVLENANQLKQLGYSRTLEEEADVNGLKLLKQRHLNPQGMADLFKALKKQEGDSESMPQFLSTHPLTSNRIAYVNKDIAKHNYSVREDMHLDSLWNEIKINLNE